MSDATQNFPPKGEPHPLKGMPPPSAVCSYCGQPDVPVKPLVTDEGLTIFMCEECAASDEQGIAEPFDEWDYRNALVPDE